MSASIPCFRYDVYTLRNSSYKTVNLLVYTYYINGVTKNTFIFFLSVMLVIYETIQKRNSDANPLTGKKSRFWVDLCRPRWDNMQFMSMLSE